MSPIRINLSPRVVPGERIAAVDEIKGLAILLVIIYHCGAVLGYENVIHGEIGVDLFLILSGLTLALSSAKIPLRDFFLRRFLRIYPTYWLALAVLVWLLRHVYHHETSWASLWQHIVGIHAFSRLAYFSDISDPLWFISMIVAAYVAFACIRSRLDDLSFVFAVTGFLTLLATVAYQDKGHLGGLISLAVRIPSFFVGVVAGRLLGTGTGEIKLNVLLGIGLGSFYYLTFFRGIACNYTLPAIAIILTWIGLRRHVVTWPEGRFALSAFSLLGGISYEVYLFHQPLVRDYNLILMNPARYPTPSRGMVTIGVLVGLVITLVVSAALHAAMGKVYTMLAKRPRVITGAARA